MVDTLACVGERRRWPAGKSKAGSGEGTPRPPSVDGPGTAGKRKPAEGGGVRSFPEVVLNGDETGLDALLCERLRVTVGNSGKRSGEEVERTMGGVEVSVEGLKRESSDRSGISILAKPRVRRTSR